MELRAFLSNLTPPEVDAFAEHCEVTAGHLRNVMYGYKACAPDLAVSIERESKGQVTRPELRKDWIRFWPELATAGDREKASKPKKAA